MPEPRKSAIDFEDAVEQLLRNANVRFERGKVVGEARPDFLITTANGDQIVVEAKAWTASPDATARALHQALRYKELSRVAASVVVTPAVLQALSSASIAVTPPGELVSTIATLASQIAQQKKPTKPQSVHTAPKKKVFASMPFAQQYDDTFLVAMEPASLINGAIAQRVDHNGVAGPVVPQIKAMIKAAKVIVADLSESRPNVLHEVGFAEALGRPVIQICRTPIAELPFNVRNNQTIQYASGQTAKLKKALEAEIQKYV